MDSITAKDFHDRKLMEATSRVFLERIQAEREGRVAHTSQLVLL